MENVAVNPDIGARNYAGELSRVMSKVYSLMFFGLLLTAAAAYITASSETLVNFFFGNLPVFFGLLIGEVVLVIALSALRNKISSAVAMCGFILYAIVNGISLSLVFLYYDMGSIAYSFLVCCATFGIMSFIGFFTKTNLNTFGKYLMMALFGVIIAGIVNLFIMNDIFSFLISIVGLAVFIGLTAFHTQKIKNQLMTVSSDEEFKKVSVFGALTLYLDFINMFLRILSLMGKKK